MEIWSHPLMFSEGLGSARGVCGRGSPGRVVAHAGTPSEHARADRRLPQSVPRASRSGRPWAGLEGPRGAEHGVLVPQPLGARPEPSRVWFLHFTEGPRSTRGAARIGVLLLSGRSLKGAFACSTVRYAPQL